MENIQYTPQPTRHVIGLTGAAGAGKDTAAALLCDIAAASGLDARVAAFADPIRAMLRPIVPAEYMQDRMLKEQPVPGLTQSYRELAQTLGTDWGRQQNPGLWVALAELAYAKQCAEREGWTASQRPLLYILTDVRFENEAAWVRSHGGTIICIQRAARPQLAATTAGHVSEQGWTQLRADYTLTNDARIGDLRSDLVLKLCRIITRQDRRAA
jgi:hypothetical protein